MNYFRAADPRSIPETDIRLEGSPTLDQVVKVSVVGTHGPWAVTEPFRSAVHPDAIVRERCAAVFSAAGHAFDPGRLLVSGMSPTQVMHMTRALVENTRV
ncbi:hypothetical protein [Planotetraspora sp. GP83]|uniref:hypothetical protein n=1 Tax=Planotetraspora sp. GP83 TaxID=3156264 RepID=UPI003510F86E